MYALSINQVIINFMFITVILFCVWFYNRRYFLNYSIKTTISIQLIDKDLLYVKEHNSTHLQDNWFID